MKGPGGACAFVNAKVLKTRANVSDMNVTVLEVSPCWSGQ